VERKFFYVNNYRLKTRTTNNANGQGGIVPTCSYREKKGAFPDTRRQARKISKWLPEAMPLKITTSIRPVRCLFFTICPECVSFSLCYLLSCLCTIFFFEFLFYFQPYDIVGNRFAESQQLWRGNVVFGLDGDGEGFEGEQSVKIFLGPCKLVRVFLQSELQC
jgi:hypothetical protein